MTLDKLKVEINKIRGSRILSCIILRRQLYMVRTPLHFPLKVLKIVN